MCVVCVSVEVVLCVVLLLVLWGGEVDGLVVFVVVVEMFV